MAFTIDVINGLLLLTVKLACIAIGVLVYVGRDRDHSAALLHSLLLITVFSSLTIPILAFFVPSLAVPVLPQQWAAWTLLPLADLAVQVQVSPAFQWLLIVYLLGLVWVLSYLLLGIVQAARTTAAAVPVRQPGVIVLLDVLRQSMGIGRNVRLLVSEQVSGPQTWGVIRPVILLPATYQGWAQARLRRVLIHELAHIQRDDWLTKVVVRALVAWFWWLPFVWLIAQRLDWYAELACDDCVVECEGGRADYASDLLELAADLQHRGEMTLCFIERSEHYRRIQAVLDGSRNRYAVGLRHKVVLVLTSLVLLLPLASVKAVVKADSEFNAALGAGIPTRYMLLHLEDDRMEESSLFDPVSSMARLVIPLADLKRIAKGAAIPAVPGLEPIVEATLAPAQVVRVPQEQMVTLASHAAVLEDLWTDSADFAQQIPPAQPHIVVKGFLPLVTAMPVYPANALRKGIEGRVIVQFDINTEGVAVQPRIIVSQPKAVFDKAVLAAVHELRFRPPVIQGQPVILTNVTEAFIFKLTEETTGSEKSRRFEGPTRVAEKKPFPPE